MGGWRSGLAVAGGLAVLALALWLLGPEPETTAPPPASPGPLPDETAELRKRLAAERERADRLEAEVAALGEELARLRATAPLAAGGSDETDPSAPEDGAAESSEPGSGELWFDDTGLHAGGVPLHEIEHLRELFDASEMDVIELQHRAQRGGWFGTKHYARELRDLRYGLRSEIGDEAFDLLLYATGRSNRVVVQGVLGDSPAERSGFQAGDQVLSYDEQRVFQGAELRSATTQGERGERVVVEVMRDGERIRLYTQRGPLGTRLGPARVLPEGRW